MASERLFSAYPPFPVSIPIASIPQISLSKVLANDPIEAQQVFTACRTLGFFLLDLQEEKLGAKLLGDIEKLFGVTKDLMDLSIEEKSKYAIRPPTVLTGYKAQGAMKNEKGNPDRCQFFNVAQDDILGNEAPHANPKPVQDNRETFLSFLRNARCIIELILEIIDAKLGLIKGTLASLQRQDRPSGSVIRMTRYSPWSPTEQNSGSALVNHTDYGTITMLCNILGGLQILPPGRANKEENWQYVKPVPNNVIINLGDAMVEWTGQLLRSNEHRVTFAPGSQAEHPRYSIAYLVRPEKTISMKRLVGGYIPSAAEDGQEEVLMSAEEWEMKKAMALKNGADCAKSKGGRDFKISNGAIEVI